MKKRFKYILFLIILLSGIGLFSLNADLLTYTSSFPDLEVINEDNIGNSVNGDTIPPRYPVSKTVPEEYNDIVKQSPADLHDPENVKTTIEYDIRSGVYIVKTKVGEMELGTPLTLTPKEYQDYSLQQSIRSYFRQKNEDEFLKETNKSLNLMDMQFDLGAAEKIFGPGGVRVRTQGSAEVTIGLKNNKTDNPTLPQSARSRTFFNFDESVQLNVQANVGSKVNFGMNYNTESSFDFDSKKLKLAYAGEEDEIIKNIEAGNVSMTTNNSLIRGGAALFGIKTDLQFGKLRVNTLFAQQESESKTVSSKGGVQTQPFEITIDQYDENRHFFLGHYFRDRYDEALADLPTIQSAVTLNRVEVWVTNLRGNYDQSRNIVAFVDLGERDSIGNNNITPLGDNRSIPLNNANTLYNIINSDKYKDARSIKKVTQALAPLMEEGEGYESIESARRLDESEYTVHNQLGYISLKTQLQASEVLAVAYEYQYGGSTYQVGEFSTDNTSSSSEQSTTQRNLFVKLLKGKTNSPKTMYWDLMMKNIYSLGAYSIQKEKFKLDILHQSDTTGTYLSYLSEGEIKDSTLLRVMNLDNLDFNNNPRPDGFFDFLPGLTILTENGRVVFPVVEPFGSHLRKKINNKAIADKYVFQELYDLTLTDAKQVAEKNKFILRGEYKASSGAEIQLGASNVARGSVIVKAGGVILAENVDYTVDYTSGVVTIINESVITSGTKVDVTLENQSMYSMQRKTMMGVDLNYQFNRDFSLGVTAMHLSEMPLVAKASFGEESVKNTLWGLNTSYRGESQWLTNLVDKLPLLTLTKPSQISFNAEFAHLIAGHYENKKIGGYSYLDDFESTQSKFNLSIPYAWSLASTPYEDSNPLFPEANLIEDIDYGKNRSLLAWYTIDGVFTRQGSAPAYLRNDKDQLSSHAVRPIYSTELFKKDMGDYGDSQLQVFNLAYYPRERGPYNLDADNVSPDGKLLYPEKRWGGIMRKIDQTDFESANIEYIEFWLLDPFKIKPDSKGGDLYFNLGEISEDILKDNMKFFENGLPIDEKDSTKFDLTVWGKVPSQQNTVYAFDNTPGARKAQDVGLNGLSYVDEQTYPTYKTYVEKLIGKLSGETIARMNQDDYSPLKAPAGDRFRHFRERAFDDEKASILDRYKLYNGTEGNSQASENTGERYSTASRTVPDIEDINQDNNLDKVEKYFQYKVSLRQEDLEVGRNYIVDKRITTPTLANGIKNDSVTWYQFKIPVKEYNKTVGSMTDFKSIRFMRMFMTGFQDTTILRFATLDLVRGEWRSYLKDLYNPNMPPVINATLDVSTVNIEENSDRKPVNYVLPPGVSRMLDPGQQQLRRENEQSLSLKVTNLASQDARAVYKNANYDLRQYKRMQLFTHAEAFINDVTQLKDGDVSVFIRLGSDYKNNYYEYEIPLTLTPHGINSRDAVWPTANIMDLELETLTDLKLERNRIKREGQNDVTFQTIYSKIDPKNIHNTRSIIGNPSLSEVKVIMIGVRNRARDIKSTEVWINELRLTDFNEEGGWAANANLNIALSDLGTVNLGTRIETAGFGGLDQSVNERRIDNYTQYSVATTMELGKFFPEKAKVSIPIYYGYSKETISPKYNPLDQDILLKDALDIAETKAEKDSIRNFAGEKNSMKSISLNNVRVNIQSKNPMPYDPANFSFGYSYSENQKRKPDIEYENTQDYRGNLAYNYSPYVKPFSPFKNIKQTKGSTKYVKQLSLNYLPSNISFQTAMMRNYYEIQLRNLQETPDAKKPPVSFSDNIYWDRAFRLSWNFTNNLNATFESGTNSRIEEPYVQVSKKYNPNEYQMWKDSVMQSIADLGTPMKYDQKFNVNYNLPTQFIPILDWATGSLRYSSSYNWDRGARMKKPEDELGNIIKNQRQFDIQGAFNLQALYNKSKFLKSVNQKFSGTQTGVQRVVPKQKPKLELDVQLNTDSGTIVQHGMLTKKLYVRARGADGKLYAVKFKPINYAQILIQNKDTANIKLTIIAGPPPTEDFLYKAAEYSSRLVMMVRRFNIQYSITDGMMLPGFQPEIGNFFGQGRTDGGLSPGLGFAFGSVSRRYIDDAQENGWLINRDNNITPAIINHAKTLKLNMNIEPFSGLKIDLTADRVETQDTRIQFMQPGMPETRGGNFSMSTIALSSAFAGKGNLANNYASKSFDTFRNNRHIIASRLENKYMQTTYPNTGFIGNDLGSLVGKPYNPANGKVNLNSTDVLIPAFIAAYTGKNANNVSLSPFPSITSLLPNWRITYDGLVKVPAIKKHFKSIILSHQYRGAYNVGSFTSFLNWADAGKDDLGFIRDILTNNPTPSSPYSISAVSITEGFNPLIGVDGTLLNNITLRTEYRTTRNLNLNISSYQLIESTSNEIVVGVGYKYTEFNKILKMKKTRDFSNDLSVRVDFSHRKMQSLIRKIEENLTQATSGNIAQTIQFSADYGLSRALTLRAFYDVQVNKPLVSNASYPTRNSSYGISMRFSLAQ